MTCYLRNGTASPKAAPCDHNAVLQNRHTGCCDPGDLCLTNGLCRNPNVNDLTNYAWFFGCTDKTFNDPACGNYCDTVNSDQHQLVFQCPGSNTWCCNQGDIPHQVDRINRTNTACCSVTQLLFEAPAPSVYATAAYLSQSGIPFSIATIALSTPTSSISSTNAAQASFSSIPNSSSPTSFTIGLGAGLSSGIAILIALGWVLMWRWWRKRGRETSTELPNDNLSGVINHDAEKGGKTHLELAGNDRRYELDGGIQGHELSDSDKRSGLHNQDSPIEKGGYREPVELPETPH